MVFPFGSAVITEHSHATEDEQRLLASLRGLLPESVQVRRSRARGHHGNPITVFEARVGDRKALKEFLQRVLAGMSSRELERLRSSVQERVDDSCNFYLRFDKQAAQDGELVLTERGDAIHIRIKVFAFPAKREVAVSQVLKFLQDRGRHEV